MPGAQFVGAYDTDPKKSNFPTLEALADAVDAVSVATPTDSHLAVAQFFLERGKHCLVEKPIANNVRDAEVLVALRSTK